MSRRNRGAWILAIPVVFGIMGGAACAGDSVVVPASDAPFLYLVLNQQSISNYDSIFEPHQLALLLTTGPTLEPSSYRAATRFDMRRMSDGVRFDWRVYPNLTVEPGTSTSVQLLYANYHLPDSSGLEPLGADSLLPGETYTLEIDTEGVTIHGQVIIPEDFTVSLKVRDGERIAYWPRVRGAVGYFVGAYPYARELQTDTSYAIPADAPGGHPLNVTAVDPNLYRYITDDKVGRAGIDRGFGVFGAISIGTATVPALTVSERSAVAVQGATPQGGL